MSDDLAQRRLTARATGRPVTVGFSGLILAYLHKTVLVSNPWTQTRASADYGASACSDTTSHSDTGRAQSTMCTCLHSMTVVQGIGVRVAVARNSIGFDDWYRKRERDTHTDRPREKMGGWEREAEKWSLSLVKFRFPETVRTLHGCAPNHHFSALKKAL